MSQPLPPNIAEAVAHIKFIESLPEKKMTQLGERNIALLSLGGKTTGSMLGAYSYVEEELYVDEATTIFEFCKWVDKEIGGCSSHNMAGLFLAFRYPDNKVYKAFADNVKAQIAEINALVGK